MPKKLVTVQEGEILAIPLFLSGEDLLRRFKKSDFQGQGKVFAFGRVIADLAGGGILIEIFDLAGGLDTPIARITASARLFRPLAISGLAIHEKRWPSLGHQEDYDKYRDSDFTNIGLVQGVAENPVLWKGGVKQKIRPEEAQAHEPWIIWQEDKLEERVLKEMRAKKKMR